jgi:hypothetical protein
MSESKTVHVAASALTRAELLRLGLVRPPLDAAPSKLPAEALPTSAPLPATRTSRTPCAVCGRTDWTRSRVRRGKLLCVGCAKGLR